MNLFPLSRKNVFLRLTLIWTTPLFYMNLNFQHSFCSVRGAFEWMYYVEVVIDWTDVIASVQSMKLPWFNRKISVSCLTYSQNQEKRDELSSRKRTNETFDSHLSFSKYSRWFDEWPPFKKAVFKRVHRRYCSERFCARYFRDFFLFPRMTIDDSIQRLLVGLLSKVLDVSRTYHRRTVWDGRQQQHQHHHHYQCHSVGWKVELWRESSEVTFRRFCFTESFEKSKSFFVRCVLSVEGFMYLLTFQWVNIADELLSECQLEWRYCSSVTDAINLRLYVLSGKI